MRFHNIDKAAQVADERRELLALRTAALTSPVTIAAGCTPLLIDRGYALALIDTLLRHNEEMLKELGVTEILAWQMPQRPPEKAQ